MEPDASTSFYYVYNALQGIIPHQFEDLGCSYIYFGPSVQGIMTTESQQKRK